MKKPIAWIMTAVVLYLIFLVAYLPAGFVWRYLPHPQGIELTSVDGTVWNGHASALQWPGGVLHQPDWSLGFWPLLMGKLNSDFQFGQFGGIRGQGQLSLGFSSLGVSDGKLILPLEQLSELNQQAAIAGLKGELRVQVGSLKMSDGKCTELQGRIAGSAVEANPGFGRLKLGQINAKLSCQQGVATANISQKSKELKFDGVLTIQPNGSYQLKGAMTPLADFPPSLKSSLAWIGKMDPQGRYHIQYRGRA
ncbi:type II secretion system protein N [Dongshaea marina]|uniref:type II secretion system protein N n=1 Tax=Dongshaea marina TaxID=2047966 RepID=UPI000D3E28B7|nr:type II secretion system protein N [Dongshaea marina]